MSSTRTSNSSYEAVLAITLALVVVYYYFFPDQKALLVGTMLFALLCHLFSSLADGVAWLWEKLTLGLGWFMSRVLFASVFFLLLTPIALLYRLFGKNDFYKSTERESYFVDRDHQFGAEDIENPW